MSEIGPTEWGTPAGGVGPWVGDLPDNPRYDPVLLREGDSRNVVDAYRYWTREAIIADIERFQSGEERLDPLARHAFGHGAAVEIRMRNWADNNADAARALSDIDRRRQQYIEQLLVRAGIAMPLAATRAQLLYWTYLGAALSRTRLTGERLNRMVTELKRIALGGLPRTRRSANRGSSSPLPALRSRSA